MRYTRAAEFARSHLAAMREMIATTHSPLTRFNLESRLEGAEEEVRAAERRAAALAEATVLFDGAPVKARVGIDAGFGGASIRGFQELVVAVTAELGPGVGKRGPLPDVPRLLITDVDVGSFGFQLAEVCEQEPLAGASPLKEALDDATRLLAAAGESDEAFEEALAARPARVLGKLKDFLKVVADADATLKVNTGRARLRLDSPEAVRAARDRAEATVVTEAEDTLTGVLAGLLPQRAQFELRPVEGELLTGRIDPSLDPATLVPRFNQPVVARLRKVTASRGGRSRTGWVLLSAAAVEAE